MEEENIIINEDYNNVIDYDNSKRVNNNIKKEKGKDKNIVEKLLDQMDFLTRGQLSLEKMFNNIQMDTQEQIENLNINFENLQSKTNRLNKDFNDYNLSIY